MGNLPFDICELIAAEKQMSYIPQWNTDNSRYFMMLVPLTAGSVTLGGFSLRLKISKEFLDRDAVAQIEYGPSRRLSEPLWRLDWRPTHRHENRGNGAPGFEWADFNRVSHDHNFNDNYIQAMDAVRRNLPRARPFPRDPTTASDFLDFSGKCFNIKNISSVKLPDNTIDMFWMKDE